jgi:hypothetical protein
MSHPLNFAIAIPEQPLFFAVPVAVIVLVLAIMVIRKRRATGGPVSAWTNASEELGIQLIADGSDLGPVAQGKVNSHVVTIAPTSGKGRKSAKVTQYSVKFEAPEAPRFVLVGRVKGDMRSIDTGNSKFDAVVSVQTEQPELLCDFLTVSRRAAILRLLTYWPSAEITNREAHLSTPGIEEDFDKLVDSICHLVAAAETFDRPTDGDEQAPTATPIETHPATDAIAKSVTTEAGITDSVVTSTDVVADGVAELGMDEVVAAARAIYEGGLQINTDSAGMPSEADPEHITNDSETLNDDVDSGVLTDVRLDEIAVLGDLFNSGHDPAGITTRVHQVYQGRAVNWSGEVLRVGSTDDGFQRIAALIGSADGQTPNSGRVVALTAVGAEPVLSEGDVVSFSGSLVNLDASQRLFQIA